MTRGSKLEWRIARGLISRSISLFPTDVGNVGEQKSLANWCRIRVQGAAVNFKPLRFLQQAKDPATANLGSNMLQPNQVKSYQINQVNQWS